MTIEEMAMETSSETVQLSTLYRRELPGAGYVAIDVTRDEDDAKDRTEDGNAPPKVYVLEAP